MSSTLSSTPSFLAPTLISWGLLYLFFFISLTDVPFTDLVSCWALVSLDSLVCSSDLSLSVPSLPWKMYVERKKKKIHFTFHPLSIHPMHPLSLYLLRFSPILLWQWAILYYTNKRSSSQIYVSYITQADTPDNSTIHATENSSVGARARWLLNSWKRNEWYPLFFFCFFIEQITFLSFQCIKMTMPLCLHKANIETRKPPQCQQWCSMQHE